MTENIIIQKMTHDEFITAVSWAELEGWNPGLNDADIFWKTDPGGYIAMKVNDEIVGSGSIISYDGKFGFMGFFIMKPEYRGKGFGKKLWFYRRDKLLERLDKDAPIGMDGVFNMQEFYLKGGFKFSHRNLRMVNDPANNIFTHNFSENVRAINEFDLNEIINYDTKHFGFPREKFINMWITDNGHKTFGYDNNNKLAGFGTIRKCIKGYKIGPLFADNFEFAKKFIRSL